MIMGALIGIATGLTDLATNAVKDILGSGEEPSIIDLLQFKDEVDTGDGSGKSKDGAGALDVYGGDGDAGGIKIVEGSYDPSTGTMNATFDLDYDNDGDTDGTANAELKLNDDGSISGTFNAPVDTNDDGEVDAFAGGSFEINTDGTIDVKGSYISSTDGDGDGNASRSESGNFAYTVDPSEYADENSANATADTGANNEDGVVDAPAPLTLETDENGDQSVESGDPLTYGRDTDGNGTTAVPANSEEVTLDIDIDEDGVADTTQTVNVVTDENGNKSIEGDGMFTFGRDTDGNGTNDDRIFGQMSLDDNGNVVANGEFTTSSDTDGDGIKETESTGTFSADANGTSVTDTGTRSAQGASNPQPAQQATAVPANGEEVTLDIDVDEDGVADTTQTVTVVTDENGNKSIEGDSMFSFGRDTDGNGQNDQRIVGNITVDDGGNVVANGEFTTSSDTDGDGFKETESTGTFSADANGTSVTDTGTRSAQGASNPQPAQQATAVPANGEEVTIDIDIDEDGVADTTQTVTVLTDENGNKSIEGDGVFSFGRDTDGNGTNDDRIFGRMSLDDNGNVSANGQFTTSSDTDGDGLKETESTGTFGADANGTSVTDTGTRSAQGASNPQPAQQATAVPANGEEVTLEIDVDEDGVADTTKTVTVLTDENGNKSIDGNGMFSFGRDTDGDGTNDDRILGQVSLDDNGNVVANGQFTTSSDTDGDGLEETESTGTFSADANGTTVTDTGTRASQEGSTPEAEFLSAGKVPTAELLFPKMYENLSA